MIRLTGTFCSSHYGFFIITEQGLEVTEQSQKIWGKEHGWHENKEVKQLVIKLLPSSEARFLESWKTLDIETNSDLAFNLMLYTNFPLSGDKVGWLAFLNSSDKCNKCNKDRHSALMTSRENLLAGIHRRLTDIRILKRNEQLQDSLIKLKKHVVN
ncbi:hypothetical protein ACLKMH_05735 [Psychromonas sp. KJ10-10]|uniref:hypothetical protein n=1 Tax=Psychromonas sp. KJ10-10 TaxID=3391823 RepID=UPI0039B3E779